MKYAKKVVGAALLSVLMSGVACAAPSYSFKLVDTIPLPTKPGHGDFVVFDPTNNYVYVSLNGSGMAVVDTKTNTVVHNFPDISSPNTMTYDDNYVYETAADGAGAGKQNQVVVIDKKTWQIVDRVNTKGTSPDGTFIDPANNELYVVMDDDNSVEVYSTGAHPVLKRKIALYPPNPVAGPDVANLYNGTIYATDDYWVLKVDPNTGAIGTKMNYGFKLNKFGGTKDMFWDDANKAIWVATTTAGVLVINPDTLAVEKRLPQTGGADEMGHDLGLGLVYVFEGSTPGFDVYSIKDMERIATVKTGTKKPTHSGAVDPATHLIYAYAGGDAALKVYQPIAN